MKTELKDSTELDAHNIHVMELVIKKDPGTGEGELSSFPCPQDPLGSAQSSAPTEPFSDPSVEEFQQMLISEEELDFISENYNEIKTNPSLAKDAVMVGELKPITIPIPLTIPATDVKDNDIVVNYTKKGNGHHPLPKSFICTICNTGFPKKSQFELHLQKLHSDKFKYPCQYCGKKFKKRNQKKKHETIHDLNRFNGEPTFACTFCEKKYHLKVSLQSHLRLAHYGYKAPKRPKSITTEHHSAGVKNHRPIKKERQLFKCPHCDLKFAMRSLVQKHMQCHTDEVLYKCEVCGQPLKTKGTLRAHMKARHRNHSDGPRPIRPHFLYKQPCPCEVCGKVYRIPSQLRKHMRSHTGEKPFECSFCGEKFGTNCNLKSHIKNRHNTDNDGEKFKCIICGKHGFVLISALHNHRSKVHRHIPIPHNKEVEKPYGCGICGKPHFTKNGAIVCTLLRHDPTSLSRKMFKLKCPGCPEDAFGYHSAIALRSHWEKDHQDKPLPNKYRAASGMYLNGTSFENKLPNVVISRDEEKKIRTDGPPHIKLEYPLYVEFPLLPVETVFYKDLPRWKRPFGKSRKTKKGRNKSTSGGNLIRTGVNVNDEAAIRRLLGNRTVEIKINRIIPDDSQACGQTQDIMYNKSSDSTEIASKLEGSTKIGAELRNEIIKENCLCDKILKVVLYRIDA